MILVANFLSYLTVEKSLDVGTYFRKHSKLGLYFPLLFNIRLIAISSLLFVYHISKTVPSYFIVIIQLAYLLLIIFGVPHRKMFDIIRSICL